jgi:hypothetical protein
MAVNPGLTSYDDFVTKADESMSYLYTLISQPDDVAKVVFEAATDGKNTLRYVAGNDAKSWIKARTSLDDEQYMEYIKGQWRI